MNTVFKTLYATAVRIRVSEQCKGFTRHHTDDEREAEESIRAAITPLTTGGEDTHPSDWNMVRIFCRNFHEKGRATQLRTPMRDLLDNVAAAYPDDQRRINELPAAIRAAFVGRGGSALAAAVEKLTDPREQPSLGGVSYLRWLASRWLHWANRNPSQLLAADLRADIDVLSDPRSPTRLPGVSFPLAAGFLSNLGLSCFCQPDGAVCDVLAGLDDIFEDSLQPQRSLTVSVFDWVIAAALEERDRHVIRHQFDWLGGGGLMPVHYSRLIHVISADDYSPERPGMSSKSDMRRLVAKLALKDGPL
jgi:hypothetical protein